MIADYRVPAELSAIDSTADGKCLVLGTVDGCVTVLVIADPLKPEMKEYLKQLPSRNEEVHVMKITDIYIYYCYYQGAANLVSTYWLHKKNHAATIFSPSHDSLLLVTLNNKFTDC